MLISEYLDEFLPNGELMFISFSYSEYLEKNLKKITNLQKKKTNMTESIYIRFYLDYYFQNLNKKTLKKNIVLLFLIFFYKMNINCTIFFFCLIHIISRENRRKKCFKNYTNG